MLLVVVAVAVGHARLLAPHRPRPAAAAAGCDACELVVFTAEQLTNSTNVTVVVSALEAACSKLFRHNDTASRWCDDLASVAAKALKRLDVLAGWDSAYPPRVVCALLADACTLPCCSTPAQPEQVYATLGANDSVARVSWVTLSANQSVVQWGVTPGALTASATGITTTYTDGARG